MIRDANYAREGSGVCGLFGKVSERVDLAVPRDLPQPVVVDVTRSRWRCRLFISFLLALLAVRAAVQLWPRHAEQGDDRRDSQPPVAGLEEMKLAGSGGDGLPSFSPWPPAATPPASPPPLSPKRPDSFQVDSRPLRAPSPQPAVTELQQRELSLSLIGPSLLHADPVCADPPTCSRFVAAYRAWDAGTYQASLHAGCSNLLLAPHSPPSSSSSSSSPSPSSNNAPSGANEVAAWTITVLPSRTTPPSAPPTSQNEAASSSKVFTHRLLRVATAELPRVAEAKAEESESERRREVRDEEGETQLTGRDSEQEREAERSSGQCRGSVMGRWLEMDPESESDDAGSAYASASDSGTRGSKRSMSSKSSMSDMGGKSSTGNSTWKWVPFPCAPPETPVGEWISSLTRCGIREISIAGDSHHRMLATHLFYLLTGEAELRHWIGKHDLAFCSPNSPRGAVSQHCYFSALLSPNI
ncbi:unnamed protein product [Closterium sp. NIES-64]|nr:unnamed protein product [Closterium sp. NIES-64]